MRRKFVNMMMWDGKKTLSQRILKEVELHVNYVALDPWSTGKENE